MSRLVDAVRRFAATHGLTGPGLAAVSGGADSVALLHALRDATPGPLTVGHFDHQLRGAASAVDARFVESLATRLGLPFRLGTADVAAEAAATGGNLEAIARQFRYDWLAATAAAGGAAWVATGHTADDQAETVLHRIVRGTGIDGLRGIAADRAVEPGSPVRLVRPLLAVTRADVLADLSDRGQPFVEDATNADPRFTRTRIRHELLPLLKTFNPEVVSVLGRLACQAEEETRTREAEARALVATAELPRVGDRLVFDAARLRKVSEAWIVDVFRHVWEREGWPRGGMTFAHWRRLAGVARESPLAADFPGGITARRVGPVVQLVRRT